MVVGIKTQDYYKLVSKIINFKITHVMKRFLASATAAICFGWDDGPKRCFLEVYR